MTTYWLIESAKVIVLVWKITCQQAFYISVHTKYVTYIYLSITHPIEQIIKFVVMEHGRVGENKKKKEVIYLYCFCLSDSIFLIYKNYKYKYFRWVGKVL